MLLPLWAGALEEVTFRRYRRVGDLGRLLLFATLENFGYRQRTVWWRVQAFWSGFRQKQAWGEMTRKGFETAGKQAIEPATTRRTDAQRWTGDRSSPPHVAPYRLPLLTLRSCCPP